VRNLFESAISGELKHDLLEQYTCTDWLLLQERGKTRRNVAHLITEIQH
jgi:hypothetical protein